MTKRLLSLALLIAIIISAHAQETAIEGKWQFYFAKDKASADAMVDRGFYRPDFSAEGFDLIAVPSCWTNLGYEEPVYRGFTDDKAGEGLYIKRFTIPSDMKGRRIQLNFGGVWASAEVWLNGKWIGRHDSGFTSFAYNIDKEALPGQENVLAVRVRQTYKGYKCDNYDDWSLGGIYRPVSVSSKPKKLWMDYVRANTTLTDNYSKAIVNVSVMVGDEHETTLPGNYRSPGKPYELRITLTDKNGNTHTWQQTCPGHTATSRLVTAQIEVGKPLLWTAETPHLYTLKAELAEHGNVVQTETKKIGLREISTKGGVFRINGVAVKLRGVNRHDEWPDVGRATTHEHWLKDLTMMKEANINFVRTAHYQHAKGFIEMCDSIGMYVGSEISLGGAGGPMKDPGFYAGMMLRVVETVERDIDNPSIVYWSVGNEDCFNTMYHMAAKATKALDPTRPVLYPWNADEHLPEDIDILSSHYWSAAEYDSMAAASKRPIITTEYVHAYGTDRFGGLEECWNALTKHPAGTGGAVWMWADQGLKTPIKINRQNFSNKVKDDYLRVSSAGWDGITDSYRNPTRDYNEVKAVYSPVKIDVSTVKPEAGRAAITLRNDNDFTSLDNYSHKWTLFVDGKAIDNGSAVVNAAPHSKAQISVPLKKLKRLRHGQTAYINIKTYNKNGFEIYSGTAILDIDSDAEPTGGKLNVAENNGTITVTANRNTYVFARQTGTMTSAAKNGKMIARDMKPSVWHKLNEGELTIRNRSFAKGCSLEKMSHSVKGMDIRQTGGKVVITSTVDYVANDSNKLTANYTFTITPNGRMNVDYTLSTDIQTTLLPHFGLQIRTNGKDYLKHWFGLGPDDAYPNKKAYPQPGLYSGRQAYGTKAVKWMEIGTGKDLMRIDVDGYLVRDLQNAQTLHIAGMVLGRVEKGRLKNNAYRLNPKGTHKGHFSIY